MKLLVILAALFVLVGLAVFLFKLISGAVIIVTGALNAILGLALVLALVIIVIWMFRYAAKHK